MKSLRHQLTVALGLSTAALLVIGGLAIFFVTRGVLDDQFDDTLVAKATALITATEIDDGIFEIDLTVQDFAGFGEGGEDYFEIRREDQSVLADSPSLRIAVPGLLPRLAMPRGQDVEIVSGFLADGRPARFYIQRFVPKDDFEREHQDLHLIAASPTRDLRYSLGVLASVIAGVGLLLLALIVPVLRQVLGRGLRPLDELSRQVRAISPGRLDQRLDLDGQPEELVPLGSALNAWLGRIEASFERERRFSSHAAHELRTPLAELRAMAELGATWPEEAGPERCAEILKVADELQSLLDKLSLLARADAGSQPVERVGIDLESTLAAMEARFAAAAAKRKLRFIRHVTPGPFRADPVLWNAILQNLIGNAVAHAPAGSEVRIVADPARLEISNPAPGLVREDLDRLFERFWRKEQRHRGEDHSGLGLSIVRACVLLLGGAVEPSLDEAGIFKVAIHWQDLGNEDSN